MRARQIAAVCAVLAIGAAGSAVFGYVSMKRAQEAELKAQQTRQMAEAARGEAEKLIVYLLDDFYLELEPVGRLDIVAALAKRAVDYYAALPPELRTAETDRNRALALVRYGAALRNQSKLDESGKALSEAVDVLSKLRKEGDQSEATAIGLGMGLTSEARVASSQNRRAEEREFATQAVDVLKPLMAAPNPSIPLRRAYGLAMTYLGFSQANTDEEEAAVETLEEARERLPQHRRPQARRPAFGGRVRRSVGLADERAADSGSFRRGQGSRRRRHEGDGTGAGKAAGTHAGAPRRAL